MTNKFKSKKAIVTGGGSGIGRGLALELASRGANVCITDINADRLTTVLAELKNLPGSHFAFEVDHSKKDSTENFATAYHQEVGTPDILCLNAGVGVWGSFSEIEIEKWKWVFGVNVWGNVYMLKNFLADLQKKKSGHILITASSAGLIGLGGMTTYSSSKFAMVGMAESLRIELQKDGISVSALCPGIVNTNIVQDGVMDASMGNKENVLALGEKVGGTVEELSQIAITGLAAGSDVIVYPLNTNLIWRLKRLSIGAFDGFNKLIWRFRDRF